MAYELYLHKAVILRGAVKNPYFLPIFYVAKPLPFLPPGRQMEIILWKGKIEGLWSEEHHTELRLGVSPQEMG